MNKTRSEYASYNKTLIREILNCLSIHKICNNIDKNVIISGLLWHQLHYDIALINNQMNDLKNDIFSVYFKILVSFAVYYLFTKIW